MESILGYIQSKPLFYIISTFVVSINFLLMVLLGLVIYYIVNIANQHLDSSKRIVLRKKYYFRLGLAIIILLFINIIYSLRELVFLVLTPIIWAIIFSYLLNPIVHSFEKRGLSRLWGVVLLYSIIALLGTFFSIAITPKITAEVKNLIDILPKFTDEANKYINGFYNKVKELDNFSPQMSIITNALQENLSDIQSEIIEFTKEFTTKIFNVFSNIINLALIPIYSFYFLKDTAHFKKILSSLIPKKFRPELIKVFKDVDKTLSKFIRGQIIVAFCVGVLSTIALLILQIDFAFLIGLVAGVSNFIPYIGPIMGAIPAIIIALLEDPMKAVWVIVAFLIIQQIESAVLSPKIVGDSVGVHPIIIIIALIIGNEVFGIVGMLFAIPVVASLKVIIGHLSNYIIKGQRKLRDGS